MLHLQPKITESDVKLLDKVHHNPSAAPVRQALIVLLC